QGLSVAIGEASILPPSESAGTIAAAPLNASAAGFAPAEPRGPARWRRPLLVGNGTFDLGTRLLGPSGSWLRGEQGRTFLGFTGLALLAAAVVLGVLDW